jgi:hypothetical protein
VVEQAIHNPCSYKIEFSLLDGSLMVREVIDPAREWRIEAD